MPLPRRLARINRVVTNRVTSPFAGRLPGFGIVAHRGRRTGSPYRTPVNVFRRPGGLAVALTYGPDAEWVKNVLAAGGAEVTTRNRTVAVTEPRVVTDDRRALVPPPVRVILRLVGVDHFLLLDHRSGHVAGDRSGLPGSTGQPVDPPE